MNSLTMWLFVRYMYSNNNSHDDDCHVGDGDDHDDMDMMMWVKIPNHNKTQQRKHCTWLVGFSILSIMLNTSIVT